MLAYQICLSYFCIVSPKFVFGGFFFLFFFFSFIWIFSVCSVWCARFSSLRSKWEARDARSNSVSLLSSLIDISNWSRGPQMGVLKRRSWQRRRKQGEWGEKEEREDEEEEGRRIGFELILKDNCFSYSLFPFYTHVSGSIVITMKSNGKASCQVVGYEWQGSSYLMKSDGPCWPLSLHNCLCNSE